MVRRRIEVWSTPNDPDGFRWLCSPPILSATTNDRPGDEVPGTGTITVPATYEHIDQIIALDPSDIAGSAASSLIRVLQQIPNPDSGSGASETIWSPVFEFFADDFSENVTDVGPVVTISGPEIRSAVDDGIVYPKSTYEPHYQWGAPTLTANSTLLESTTAYEELTVWIVPDGASDPSDTWSLTINGQSTGAMQWDISAADLKTAIDGNVTTITEALVSGQGTADDPWFIILVDDPPVNQTIVSTDNVTDGTLFLSIEVEGGQATPSYYTNAQTIEGVPFGNTGGGTLAVVDDPAGGGGKALRIIGTTEFIGAQQIIEVPVASTGYGEVEIYTASATDEFRLVLRTLDEKFVASSGGSGGYEGQTVTPSTWSPLEIGNTQLLDEHGDRLILRIAVVSQGNPSVFYIRNLAWHPGLPGTTAGDISQTLTGIAADDAARGVLDWLDLTSYDATNDANGVAWDESDLAFQADAGETLGTHVHGDLQQMGYEVDVVPIPDDELGSPGSDVTPSHYLKLFNPGGRGPTANLNGAIVIGGGITGGTISKRRVPFTHVLVETYDQGFVEVTDARLTGLPRREYFFRAEQARDVATATKVGEALLDAMIENLFASQVSLAGDSVVAYRDFDIGSTVPFTLGGSRAGRHDRRIHTISTRFDGETWVDTITASKIYAGAASGGDSPMVLEALRKLYARFERKRKPGRDNGAVYPAAIPDSSVFVETPTAPSVGPDIVEWTGTGPDPTIPLPSNMTAGDIMFLASQSDSAVALDSVPTDWVDYGQVAATDPTRGGAGIILAKDVTDADVVAGSVTLDMSSGQELAVVIWYVSGTSDTAATVAIASENPNLTNDPSPETVPVTVSDADEYWIFPIWFANKGSFPTDQATDGPSGYDAFAAADVAGGVLAPALYVWRAYKSLVTSEDPGSFSWNSSIGSRIYAFATVAVRDEPTETTGGLAEADHDHLADDIIDFDTEVGALLAALTLDDLADVDLTTASPTDGQALVWDATAEQWEPADRTLDDLGDVDTSTVAPTDGQALVWDATAEQWEPAAAAGGTSADDPYIWRPLLDDEGGIVVDDEGGAVMGYGPA